MYIVPKPLTLKFIMTGLIGFGLSIGPAFAENKASQLLLKNCGAYKISKVIVQAKEDGGDWKNTGIELGKDLQTKRSVCFDIDSVRYQTNDTSPDQYRLKAYIDGGDTVSCDGTNYQRFSTTRRIHRMSGTSLNNNNCKTLRYETDPNNPYNCGASTGHTPYTVEKIDC